MRVDEKVDTVVINLFGGSGSGKSTAAAGVFAELKIRGYHCELVREYVKGWAWAKRPPSGYDQVFLFGKQARYESSLYGIVNVLVTDSPLMLSGFYEMWHLKRELCLPSIKNFINLAKENGVFYLNFFLNRHSTTFDERGRFEKEERAMIMHSAMRKWLPEQGVDLIEVPVEGRERIHFIIHEFEQFLEKQPTPSLATLLPIDSKKN